MNYPVMGSYNDIVSNGYLKYFHRQAASEDELLDCSDANPDGTKPVLISNKAMLEVLVALYDDKIILKEMFMWAFAQSFKLFRSIYANQYWGLSNAIPRRICAACKSIIPEGSYYLRDHLLPLEINANCISCFVKKMLDNHNYVETPRYMDDDNVWVLDEMHSANSDEFIPKYDIEQQISRKKLHMWVNLPGGIKERERLHKLVWTMPTSKAAQLEGISDTGLKKRLKKMNISSPPRGYWQKVSTGIIQPQVPPLIDVTENSTSIYEAWWLE